MNINYLSLFLSVCIALQSAACSQTGSKSQSNLTAISNRQNSSVINTKTTAVSQSNSDTDFDSLIYQYTSVATNPISQYTFTVDKSGAKIVIRKNDKITDQSTAKLTGKQFAEIVETVKKSGIKKNEKPEKDSCDGGSIEELTLSKDNQQTLNGTLRSCDASGTLTGKTDDLRERLKSFFSEMEALRYF